jgi:AraC family transcriptional regulator
LRKRRIEKASHSLQNSNQSLVEIALSSGFSDQSQFTKSFKRMTGLTPAQYRNLFS